MAVDNLEVESINSDGEDVEVDLEGYLVSSLEEIERLRKKNNTPKKIFFKDKDEVVEPLLVKIQKGEKIQKTLNQ